MFKNYFKTALRNLLKNKAQSFINIFGLASGMAVAMLIGLWIWDELSFDKYHQNYDRIAQVMQNQTFNGKINTGKGTPLPLGVELKASYGGDFKYVVLSSWSMNSLISGDKKFNTQGNYMQPDAANMLTLNMLRGSRAALKDHSTILLSQTMAKNLFGNQDPMGKMVKLDNELVETVTGVYADLPLNTSFNNVTFIAPFFDNTSWTAGNEHNWYNNSFQVFVQLAHHADMAKVSEKIKDVKFGKIDEKTAKSQKPGMFLQPMAKWHLYSEFTNGVNAGGGIQYVWLFGIIGVFVLLLACINFMNLSTARSEKRAKEVGIRKAVGSLRSQLVSQFFIESLLVTAFSFVFSLMLAGLVLPFFNQVAGKQMYILWANPYFWAAGVVFSLVTGLIAGSYPALYLSSFQPVKVLKGAFKAGRFAALPRKVLVVMQFSVSAILIIGTIVVFRQVQFAKNRPIGYTREGLMTIIMETMNYHDHFAAMRNDLLKSGAIADMAESNTPITENDHYDDSFNWPGKDPNAPAVFNTIGVTSEYGKTVGWQFKDGRDFSRQFLTDSSAMVLNEAAVKYMGLKKPVGETVQWRGKPYKVIGMINDMIMESPYEPAKQSVFFIGKDVGGILNIKINPNISATAALGKIAAICKQYSPSEPFDYKFTDEEYAAKFATEVRVGKLAAFFAILAILISCMGLFGMASFMAEQRIKEIGVRKVLGASVLNLWSLMTKDFVVLVVISLFIATPVAYYFMYNWLQNFQYRSAIGWWIFAVTGAGALLITVLTVSWQSIKAALANPVKSLKVE